MAKSKRKVSHKGARQKGANAERELVKFFDKNNIPSQRVLGSGAFRGADSDLKIGINLEEDGSKPPSDESKATMRAEVKNRANTQEYLFNTEELEELCSIRLLNKACPKSVVDYLEQDKITKVALLRRAKVPSGAIAKEDYNSIYVAVMGLGDFIELFKKAYPDVIAEVNMEE